MVDDHIFHHTIDTDPFKHGCRQRNAGKLVALAIKHTAELAVTAADAPHTDALDVGIGRFNVVGHHKIHSLKRGQLLRIQGEI